MKNHWKDDGRKSSGKINESIDQSSQDEYKEFSTIFSGFFLTNRQSHHTFGTQILSVWHVSRPVDAGTMLPHGTGGAGDRGDLDGVHV